MRELQPFKTLCNNIITISNMRLSLLYRKFTTIFSYLTFTLFFKHDRKQTSIVKIKNCRSLRLKKKTLKKTRSIT